MSDLLPAAASTVLPERPLVDRLLKQGRWDETAASFWVARNLGVLSGHGEEHGRGEVSEPLDEAYRQVVAAVIAANTVDEIAAAISITLG